MSMASEKRMAIEQASSPVEQPTVQIRRVESGLLLFNRAGRTFSSKTLKASGSLKKLVTPMSISLKRISTSAGVA